MAGFPGFPPMVRRPDGSLRLASTDEMDFDYQAMLDRADKTKHEAFSAHARAMAAKLDGELMALLPCTGAPCTFPTPGVAKAEKAPADEVAWLIEIGGNAWWDGTRFGPAICAIRFARKQDAERLLYGRVLGGFFGALRGITVTEHAFVGNG